MFAPTPYNLTRRRVGENVWLCPPGAGDENLLEQLQVHDLSPEVLASEDAVGRAMLEDLLNEAQKAAAENRDLVIVLLGGRGGQAMHRQLGARAATSELDHLLGRLRVFTQDALGPLPMGNQFSFVRDFERLLGEPFFQKVKSFTPMRTDVDDLDAELLRYVDMLESAGGIDIFFLGLGPEAAAASHLAYIKPGSGATAGDLAGIIPISSTILEHHIAKFKDGGAAAGAADEAECRAASNILTLGPGAILGARRIVQSIVDASAAPAKRASFRRLTETRLSADPMQRASQLDENPGLWLRLHPRVRSLILPDVLAV